MTQASLFRSRTQDIAERGTRADTIGFEETTGETIDGTPGNDFLEGTDDADLIHGFSGGDTLDGKGGRDTIFGGAGSDGLQGHGGGDRLVGGAGVDGLSGHRGRDKLIGGPAGDALDFGDDIHQDRAVYKSLSDSTAGSGHDFIFQFDPGEDKIDLTRVDADTTADGDQAFHWIGGNDFTGAAGELHYVQVNDQGRPLDLLQGDVDGDGAADFEIAFRDPARDHRRRHLVLSRCSRPTALAENSFVL